jgi:hypothetical protein
MPVRNPPPPCQLGSATKALQQHLRAVPHLSAVCKDSQSILQRARVVIDRCNNFVILRDPLVTLGSKRALCFQATKGGGRLMVAGPELTRHLSGSTATRLTRHLSGSTATRLTRHLSGGTATSHCKRKHQRQAGLQVSHTTNLSCPPSRQRHVAHLEASDLLQHDALELFIRNVAAV